MLTGDRAFGNAAKLATRALWSRRSPQLHLLGKHIDVHSGEWTEIISGIGSNSDSFYEYLIKHYLLFPEDSDFWQMFLLVYSGIQEHSRMGEWYVDVGMWQGLTGHVRQIFESLMAFFPGLQVLLGETVPSAKTANAYFSVREFLGLLPERFDFIRWKTEGSGNVHPLRPELLESGYFLHLASVGLQGSSRGPCCNSNSSRQTSTSSWLWAADFALRAIHHLSWTPCGFATVTNVGPTTTGRLDVLRITDPKSNHGWFKARHRNEMPSYFLSETIKYLYLTFDADDNILHNDDEREWIFTTEAHPIHYSDLTSHNGNRFRTQLDQVRTLLNEIGSNTSSSIINDELSAGESATLNYEPKTTSKDTLGGLKESRNTRSDMATNGIFSSEISTINLAHYRFDQLGKGSGKGPGEYCRNYHHPDLQWTHALHGDLLDYTVSHGHPVDHVDKRMLTALSSVCFYGTNYYANGGVEDSDKICSVSGAPNYPTSTKSSDIKNTNRLDSIPGSTRYEMGGGLGAFDVSLFPGGEGFVVRQVNSQELLEVSLFHSDPRSSPSIEGRIALVVLTAPSRHNSAFNNRYLDDGIKLSWSSLNGSWGRRSSLGVVNDSYEDDTKSHIVDDMYRRVVGEPNMPNFSQLHASCS